MDPDLIKHLPEAVSVARVAAASLPFTGIVKRMLGPAADEVAEMWRDQIRLYRYQRQLKCVEKAERMAEEAGFTPNAVPPKILFPLLEGASLEEDEGLHTMWAALLANAASDMAAMVRPKLISMLREMAPDEAGLLKMISDETKGVIAAKIPLDTLNVRFHNLVSENERTRSARLISCLQDLADAGLIRQDTSTSYVLLARGWLFVNACTPPQPKS